MRMGERVELRFRNDLSVTRAAKGRRLSCAVVGKGPSGQSKTWVPLFIISLSHQWNDQETGSGENVLVTDDSSLQPHLGTSASSPCPRSRANARDPCLMIIFIINVACRRDNMHSKSLAHLDG